MEMVFSRAISQYHFAALPGSTGEKSIDNAVQQGYTKGNNISYLADQTTEG